MRLFRSVACLMLGLILAGCASAEPGFHWTRVDGKSLSAQQYEIDSTICRGDTQKANASGTVITGGGGVAGAVGGYAASVNRQEALGDVYLGCMAERGYLRRPDQ
jgi:hypothetical protein